MTTFIATLIVVGIIAYVRSGSGKTNPLQLAAARSVARVSHLRTGAFPSTCSWCKNTTLARKLLVFERTSAGWMARDVMSRLAFGPPAEVEELAPMLTQDQPHWRRFCTERCTSEFLAAERVSAVEQFAPCEYCSTRFPVTIGRCNNCGAARR